MFIIPSGIPSAGGYQPAAALSMETNSDFFSGYTPSGATQAWTLAWWMKLGNVATGASQKIISCGTGSSDRTEIYYGGDGKLALWSYFSSTTKGDGTSDAVYRDPTSWMHVCFSWSGSALKIFINGTETTSDWTFATAMVGGQHKINDATEHRIGIQHDESSQGFGGMLADFIMIDGTAVSNTDDFGEVDSDTGIFVPKDPSDISSFGTDGFWLNFADGRYPGLDVHSSATGATDLGVKHLIHWDGEDGDDGDDDVTDSGLSAATLSFTGNAQLDTSVKKFGDSSLLLDGSGDEVSFTCPVFETYAYTIDFWIYPTSSTHNNAAIMGNRAGTGDDCLIIYFKSGYNNRVAMDTPMSNIHLGSSATELSVNTWYHVAFTYDGTNNRQFINGTLVDTTATSFDLDRVETWRIGQDNSGNKPNDLTGHIDELRIVHGVCKWTASFTPETSAYSNPTKNNSFIPASISTTNFVADGPANSTDKEVTLYPTLDPAYQSTNVTYTNGNLTVASNNGNAIVRGTIPLASGKWYWRVKILQVQADGYPTIGIVNQVCDNSSGDGALGHSANSWGVHTHDDNADKGGVLQHENILTAALTTDGTGGSATAVEWGVGDYVDVAFNADNGEAWWGKNGTWLYKYSSATQGNPATRAEPHYDSIDGGPWYPAASVYSASTSTAQAEFDFTGGTAPSGYSHITSTITGVGNYCTLNPISRFGQSSSTAITLTNGNLTSAAGDTNNKSVLGSMCIPPSGKWYFEATVDAVGGSSGSHGMGVRRVGTFQSAGIGADSNARVYIGDGDKGNGSTTTHGSAWAAGNIIGVAVDMDNGALYFAINNTWQASSDPTSGSSKTNAAYTDLVSTGFLWAPVHEPGNGTLTFNFGADGFTYTPPTDYKALATHNLPEPSVTDPSAFYKTILYNGSNDSPYAVTGIADSGGTTWTPDFVWLKQRTSSTRDHYVFDSVRGQGKALHPSYVSAEDSTLTHGKLSDFDNGGFELSDGSGSGVSVKESGGTFVAWCLKANGSGSANTDGRSAGSTSEYDSTVSVASHSGFSIVKWTAPGSVASGARVGHGMGKKPEVIIIKSTTDGSDGWHFWHKDLSGVDEYLKLNTNHAETSDGWNGSSGGKAWDGHQNTNTSTFSVGDGSGTNWTNDANQTYIAYCFARTPGLIGIGKYEGTNSAEGSCVICDDGGSGFKPAFLLIKNIDSAEDWYIFDSTRSTYNPTGHILAAQSNAVERTSADNQVYLTANGWKFFDIGSINAGTNAANTYVYMAFAERPFGLNNRAR